MATILHIETSTTVCSAALSHDGRLCLSRVCAEGMSHASKLPVFINEMLQYCRSHHLQCDAVAVSAGPGSYTGLRIGVSTAKGICYGLNAKLLAIDTLQLTARAALPEIADENALICPMTDARRMEVYTALYDTKLRKVLDCTAKIIDAEVPLAEMFGYVTDLRSFTQGRGNYTMQFSHYGECPKFVQEEIIKKSGMSNR